MASKRKTNDSRSNSKADGSSEKMPHSATEWENQDEIVHEISSDSVEHAGETEPQAMRGETAQRLFPLVGIGASAGGLAALKKFFPLLPPDTGMAFVVVVHLAPDHKSHLAELLQPHVKLPVQQITETTQLQPNRVYVIPPNANLDSIDTHLRLSQLEVARQARAPIDHFFRTLANTHDGRSIGVVLTGTGCDGTLGLRQIKEAGGLTIAQDPNDAEYDGMPQSAISSGLVDLILPLNDIPEAILGFARTQPKVTIPPVDENIEERTRRLLLSVFADLRIRTGRDFTHYKQSTILRRVSRRMQIRRIEDFELYADLLHHQPDEVRKLADDLLVTVTNFFRDREVFEVLEKDVIPKLVERQREGEAVRVWSVGCATGEEAYSIAILLLEEAARLSMPPLMQVFASDLHETSLSKAREGVYPGDIETDVSPERLRRFFQKEGGGYRIRKEVREIVVFAPHNVLLDPPFSRLDMVSCRNVFIYLDRTLQKDLVELFHYALKPEGLLLLGTSETIDSVNLFTIEDKKCCLYRKRNVPAPEPRLPIFPLDAIDVRAGKTSIDPCNVPPSFGSLHQRMVELYAPPSLLLSPDDKIVHLSMHAGRFLSLSGGDVTTNVFKLIREELRTELRLILPSVREQHEPQKTKPIPVHFDGHPKFVQMSIHPALDKNEAGFILVIFEEFKEVPLEKGRASDEPFSDEMTEQLGNQLEYTQHRLQGIIEKYESSQEELRASNEELQSANEELRSTVEELETSKEELQSMNEELQTVNQENRHKVDELGQLNGDLQNLLASTEIATLFLDRTMRILRFTPLVTKLFNIQIMDRGRMLSDFTHQLGYEDLQTDVERVLEKLVPIEREVKDRNQHWYLSRILPYRSADDRIEGVVITLVDITGRKSAENEVSVRLQQFRTLVEQVVDYAIFTTDTAGRPLTWNEGVRRIFSFEEQEFIGCDVSLSIFTPEDIALGVPNEELKRASERGRASFDRWMLRKDGTPFWATGATTAIHGADEQLIGFLTVMRDHTNVKMVEGELARTAAGLANANLNKDQLLKQRAIALERRNQQLRRLNNRLTEAEQRERHRIARTLHDGLQQVLVAAKMSLPDAIEQQEEDRFLKTKSMLDEALNISRSLIFDLSPPNLQNAGLPETLEWLVQRFETYHRFAIELSIGTHVPVLPEATVMFIFTAVREMLLNCVKHSGVKSANITVSLNRSKVLKLVVADQGRGFDPSILKAQNIEATGLGLFSIMERLPAFQGKMRVHSAVGEGAKFSLMFPTEKQFE